MSGNRWLAVLCSVMLFSAFAGGPAGAGDADQRYLYQWTDDQGSIGLADDLTKVPEKYRSRAKRLQQSGAAEPENDPGREAREIRQRAAVEGDQSAASGADSDDVKKAEWQQRMSDARRDLAAAEARSVQIEQRKMELKTKWGSAVSALPPQEALDEMARLDAELATARKEADRARNQVEVVIPDEARRAGIPPGWLRDAR